MAGFDIDSYRANFKAGARAYLFQCKPLFPAQIVNSNTDQATYLVRSSTLPAGTIEPITTNWQGFDFKMAGKLTYAEWSMMFNVDQDADVLKWYIDWQRLIHDPTSNQHSAPSDYMVDQVVEMLSLDGDPILKYKLVGAWPSTVEAVTLDYATNDVAQFSVMFNYQYHIVDRLVDYARVLSFAG
jgi:hypothetical protein